MYKIFLICAGCGAASGIAYEALYVLRSLVCGMPAKVFTLKDKIFTCFCDIIWFALLAALYIFCSVKFAFPDLRLYMMAAVFLGFLFYLKSFHKCAVMLLTAIYRKFHKNQA